MHFYSLVENELQEVRAKLISVIGGGGKSSLLYRLGRELSSAGLSVILTTTTKCQHYADVGLVLTDGNSNFRDELRILIEELKIAQVGRDFFRDDRLGGLTRHEVAELKQFADVVLVEADGSRQRGLKTHCEYEPVIPAATSHVVIICSADIVGKALSSETVHRSALFAEKWKMEEGARLTPEIIAAELLSPLSYLRNVPLNAKVRYFINKVEKNRIGGRLLAEHLSEQSEYPVFLGSLKKKRLTCISAGSVRRRP